MKNVLTEAGRWARWHHRFALFGIVAIVLLQVSAAAHQFEHASDHGLTVCQLCGVYDRLDDAPIDSAPAAALPTATAVLHVTFNGLFESADFSSSYQARAPPLS